MNIYIDMSAVQDSFFGRIIRDLYYTNKYANLVALAPHRTGFPYDGGFHSFRISGSKEECETYLDLFVEAFPETSPIVNVLKSRLEAGDTKIRAVTVRSVKNLFNLSC